MGCTIAGLNQMEHHGFSSALIRGIVTSSDKAATLYKNAKSKRAAAAEAVSEKAQKRSRSRSPSP
jgi:hypothetical protein